eukprot:scaffold300_cov258-Pinguiococcus_pyrenoidosus.AAC.36
MARAKLGGGRGGGGGTSSLLKTTVSEENRLSCAYASISAPGSDRSWCTAARKPSSNLRSSVSEMPAACA